jgi:hypothetical protein
MDRISDAERQRIAELLAEGAPVWRLHKEINRSRHAIRRAVVALHRPPKREPRRSPLRLSLAGREEISHGLAAGEPVRETAPRRRCAGSGGERRPGPVPGVRGGPAGGAQDAPPQAGQAGPVPAAARGGGEQTGTALVTAADRGLAENQLPRRPADAGVSRDHLGTACISQQPRRPATRAVPGHWEADLLFGARSSTLATLTERKSRFVMLVGLRAATPPKSSPMPWPKRSPPCRSSCAGSSPGTRARRWPDTPASATRACGWTPPTARTDHWSTRSSTTSGEHNKATGTSSSSPRSSHATGATGSRKTSFRGPVCGQPRTPSAETS